MIGVDRRQSVKRKENKEEDEARKYVCQNYETETAATVVLVVVMSPPVRRHDGSGQSIK